MGAELLPAFGRSGGTHEKLDASPGKRKLVASGCWCDDSGEDAGSRMLRLHRLAVKLQLRVCGPLGDYGHRTRLDHALVGRPEDHRAGRRLAQRPQSYKRQHERAFHIASPRMRTRPRSIAPRFGTPASPISSASSVRSSSRTRSTPGWPKAARPQRYGRAMQIALAPNARAQSTSVPRRNPPSTKTGTFPFTARKTSGSASIVAPT